MPTIPAHTFENVNYPDLVYADNVSTLEGYFSGYLNGATYKFSTEGDVKGCSFIYPTSCSVIYASTVRNVRVRAEIYNNQMQLVAYSDNSTSVEYTYNNQTVYLTWASNAGKYSIFNVEPGNNYFNGANFRHVAWLMVYGDNIPDGWNVTYDLISCSGASDNPVKIPLNATITSFDFTPITEGENEFSFTPSSVSIDGVDVTGENPVAFVFDPETGHLRIATVGSDITIHVTAYGDPYGEIDGEGAMGEGEGALGGDVVAVPDFPSVSATSTGMFSLYSPSSSQMQALADYLWTDFTDSTITEVADVLKEVVEALKRTVANPLKLVLGLSIIPSQGLSKGSARNVHVGFWDTGVSMTTLSSQYFTVNCGSLSFDTLCGDTFLDYAPYSKFSIYLPYVGTKQVDANDFVGHTIGVIYHGDCVTGAVTAYITKDGSVMYQYSGSCALNLPLSAENWGATISSAIEIAGSAVSGFASGGIAGGAISLASSVAGNASQLSPQIQHSGNVAGGAGMLGVQRPYVIREAVRFHNTSKFNTVKGYPSYRFKRLSSCSGYTKCVEVNISGVPANDEELAEITSLLKEGVII